MEQWKKNYKKIVKIKKKILKKIIESKKFQKVHFSEVKWEKLMCEIKKCVVKNAQKYSNFKTIKKKLSFIGFIS